MLFALDWMKSTWDRILSWILGLTNGICIASIASVLTCHYLVLVGCLLAGVVLCISGFRYHKQVFGLICSALFGCLGWYIGRGIHGEHVSVSVIYAALLAVTGFFTGYLLYFSAVFSGGWFFFLSVLAPLSGILQGHLLWVAAILAAAYSAFYIKYKLAMSAVTGALGLGLLVFPISPALGVVTAGACTAGGICLQRKLWMRYEAKRIRAAQEQTEKYPYGPGQAYGWPEPGSTNKP